MNKLKTIAIGVLSAVAFTAYAQAAPITVYSPQGEERAKWITEQAKAAGHDINILSAGGGELFDRLMAEKANPQADVALGFIDSVMAILKSEGMFQKYVPSWADGLQDVYKGPEGMVHKFWQTPIVLAYNADSLAEADAPAGWLDLIKPQYSKKYMMRSTKSQTTRSFLVGMLVRFTNEKGEVSDEGWEFMRSFYANGVVVNKKQKKDAFASGEAIIDLNWFGGAKKQSKTLGYKLKMVDTKGGTPFISEGVAILTGTDLLAESKAFVDWFGSPAFMIAYAEKFGQAPVHPDAVAGSPDAVKADAALLTPQPIDWDAVAPKIDGWMQKIELEIR
ncbi:MAG: extracellular solute-binding protein [Nitrospinaceae bacterium]|nr:extracellular solute-binding protein [Nitrospinaceae bacterium]